MCGLPEVITLAENEICFGEESGANLAQAAIAAGAFEAILVPHLVDCLQQVPFEDGSVAAVAFRWLPRLTGGSGV